MNVMELTCGFVSLVNWHGLSLVVSSKHGGLHLRIKQQSFGFIFIFIHLFIFLSFYSLCLVAD
jgi:hypothetical protein